MVAEHSDWIGNGRAGFEPGRVRDFLFAITSIQAVGQWMLRALFPRLKRPEPEAHSRVSSSKFKNACVELHPHSPLHFRGMVLKHKDNFMSDVA